MEPKIIDLDALTLVGVAFYGNPEGGKFGKAWDRFFKLENRVSRRVDP